MSVLSLNFIIFVAAALLVYYLTPGKYQWISLLAISCVFYVFAGAWALLFILTTAVSTYFAGRRIGKINDEYEPAVAAYAGPEPKMPREEKKKLKAAEDKRKRVILILVLLLNFGILIVLKYVDPLVNLMNRLCALVGLKYTLPHVSLIVPLGISYYTFQAMGYIIDLYRRKYAPEKNFARFTLFISFFPQLIQGPISRYDDLSKQLFEPHRFEYANLRSGLVLIAWGLFKKLVIADRIAILIGPIFNRPDLHGGMYLVVATVLSLLQLYADFSGGIDIMRGVGECFGIIMPENFTRPFFSVNFSEYWRRWHITLNNWWRDYVFYPMALSRTFQKLNKGLRKIVGENFSKKLPILVSVIVIRVINSIWHGATAVSILGGVYYGLVLALSFYFEPQIEKLTKKLRINTKCFSWKLFQCLRTFIIVMIPRLVTNAKSLADAGRYFRYLFTVWNPWVLFDKSFYTFGLTQDGVAVMLIGLLTLLIVSVIQEKGYSVRRELNKQNVLFRGVVYLLLIVAIILFGIYGSGYSASAFAYQAV